MDWMTYVGAAMAIVVPVGTLAWQIVRVGNKMYDTLDEHSRVLEKMVPKLDDVENRVYRLEGNIQGDRHGKACGVA